MRGRFVSRQPGRATSEKSPDAGSRQTFPPDFHRLFTTFQQSESADFNRGPVAGSDAFHSPETGTARFTAFTSTPISSGSVFAVTSYGRLGGPPGYSRSSG